MTGLTEADNYYLTRYAHNPKGVILLPSGCAYRDKYHRSA
jgi:hypothetical protein